MHPVTNMAYNGDLTLTKWPSAQAVDLDDIISKYGAKFFREALRRYIVLARHSGPLPTRSQLEHQILYVNLPFTTVPVYHRIKFTAPGDSTPAKRVTLDSVHVRPERRTKKGSRIPARFDTALLNVGLGGETGIQGTFHPSSVLITYVTFNAGYRVGQVRVVFTLPDSVDGVPSERLAYIEWFTKFTTPDNNHQMFRLNRSVENGERVASIVPVSTIRRSAHLFPKFGSAVPEGWSSDNVLEECTSFYLNPFTDRHMYFIL